MTFELTQRRFWSTIEGLGQEKKKKDITNTVCSVDAVLLTLAMDAIRQRKEYFEDLHNPTNSSCQKEAESVDSSGLVRYWDSKDVKKLHSSGLQGEQSLP